MHHNQVEIRNIMDIMEELDIILSNFTNNSQDLLKLLQKCSKYSVIPQFKQRISIEILKSQDDFLKSKNLLGFIARIHYSKLEKEFFTSDFIKDIFRICYRSSYDVCRKIALELLRDIPWTRFEEFGISYQQVWEMSLDLIHKSDVISRLQGAVLFQLIVDKLQLKNKKLTYSLDEYQRVDWISHVVESINNQVEKINIDIQNTINGYPLHGSCQVLLGIFVILQV